MAGRAKNHLISGGTLWEMGDWCKRRLSVRYMDEVMSCDDFERLKRFVLFENAWELWMLGVAWLGKIRSGGVTFSSNLC